MEIALYVRVSTSRQQQTQTIEQQIDRLQAHVATQPGWHLAEEHIYRDDGYSGAKLNRPGLDRLREQAALAAFERVLLTAPDRLARNYVHQMLLIDELAQRGCQVEFLDRPMSDDPHDQLLLQIRGAVAEYERNLIADRMRRGRQAKLRSGQLLPWTVAPYGYLLDPERPRAPSRLRLDPVKAAVVEQIFAWYTDVQAQTSLYMVAKRLSDQQIPTPTGGARWHVASIRGILRDPAYAGTTYSGRTHPAPARQRKSALQPVGPGTSTRPAPPEDWIAIPVPAIVNQETFAAAQLRLDRNKQMARRNNTAHDYLLRGLVSCGRCRLACMGRSLPGDYAYYVCRGRSDPLRVATGERCSTRYAPAQALDDLVWQDLCRVLSEPALITHELERAQGGEWLPQALQSRRETVQTAIAHLERQQARLLEVYLAEVIGRDEFDRKRQEVSQTQAGLMQQLRQLEAQAHKQVDVMAATEGLEAFCRRLNPTLEHLTFAQRRQLVELLIDRVIISDGKVEIRYVLPTGPKGEEAPFCHLRLDYFDMRAFAIHRQGRVQIRHIRDQIEGLLVRCLPDRQDANRAVLLRGHPCRPYRQQLAPRRHQIADVALLSIHRHDDVRRRAADILPVPPPQCRLQVRPVKLAIAQQGDVGRWRDERLDLFKQGTVHRLWEVAFLPLDDDPGQGQRTAVIDYTQHQSDTPPCDDTAIHDQHEGLVGEGGQQGLGNGQKPTVQGMSVVLEPAPKARHHALLVGTTTGRMIGDGRQMGTLRPDQATDHRHQRVEMAFAMAGGTGLKELHEPLFYGSIAAVRVTHLLLQTVRSLSMEEHTRAGTYCYVSSYFLYGSEIRHGFDGFFRPLADINVPLLVAT
jgi:site-specific DNA recombinase